MAQDDLTREQLLWRMVLLHRLAADLSEAVTPFDVAQVVVEQGVQTADAKTGAVWLRARDGSLRLGAHRGLPAEYMEEWRCIAPDSELPAQQVARTRRPWWIESADELETSAPELLDRATRAGRRNAFVVLPIVAHDRVLGVLSYGFAGDHRFAAQDRALIETVAYHCGQALDRARLFDVERRANERLRLLSEVGAIFASSLDYEAALSDLTRSLVPLIADWCAIDLVDDRGIPRPVAVAHMSPERAAFWRGDRERSPPAESDPLHSVLCTGESAIVPALPGARPIDPHAEERDVRIARELGASSMMIVPLRGRGPPVGAMTLICGADGAQYDREDLDFATVLAARAALAVENARLYQQSVETARSATEANRVKDEFLATLSHELRTPLNAILGWTRMIRGGQLDPSKMARALESIERNAGAQKQLVEDLLDVSRIVTGKLRLEVQALHLAPVVEEAIEAVRPAAHVKEIHLESSIEANLPPILGDPARLQQVVWNLLSNAIKFTSRGGRVQVRIQPTGSYLEVAVSDNGQGISADFLPYVFDRFRQADASFTRTQGGLGIGLSIVRSVVELHGGLVEVHSEGPGRGSTFVVKLPQAAAARVREREELRIGRSSA
jgi:signal transduction histidine kinase